jgi:transposase
MRRAELEHHLAAGLSLETIGREVKRHPSTVAYWLRKHGLTPVHAARHAPKGEVSESSLRALVDEGLTVRQIAARLDRGTASVRHWLRVHGLRTLASRSRRPTAVGGPERIVLECSRHGLGEFVVRRDSGVYRCVRCRSEQVTKQRRRQKQLLVREAGGRCALCGYDRSPAALQFHHLDPAEKSFSLSQDGAYRSLAAAREEAAKCALLCANCHAEVEAGVAAVPRP